MTTPNPWANKDKLNQIKHDLEVEEMIKKQMEEKKEKDELDEQIKRKNKPRYKTQVNGDKKDEEYDSQNSFEDEEYEDDFEDVDLDEPFYEDNE